MINLSSALWIETIKMFRSKVPLFTAIGFSIMPLAGGLFMVILKDPEAAKSLGLITTKAQLLTGTADWPSFFDFLAQAVTAGGMILFSIITIWVFGREFSDHTIKELLARPTSRDNRHRQVHCSRCLVIGPHNINLRHWSHRRISGCAPRMVSRAGPYFFRQHCGYRRADNSIDVPRGAGGECRTRLSASLRLDYLHALRGQSVRNPRLG